MLTSESLIITVAAQAVELQQLKSQNETLNKELHRATQSVQKYKDALNKLQPKDEEPNGEHTD